MQKLHYVACVVIVTGCTFSAAADTNPPQLDQYAEVVLQVEGMI